MPPLHEVVLLAGIQGLSEALPVSRSGHDAVLRLWLETGVSGLRLESMLHLATASALLFAARRRLVVAAAGGLRAIARPSLFRSSAPGRDAATLAVALAAGLSTRALLAPLVEPWKDTSIATGFGLLLTGLLLVTTQLCARDRTVEPSLSLAFVVGLAHATAVLPGGSDVGAALVVAAWMGLKNDVALDLAMILSGTALFARFVSSAYVGNAFPDLSSAVLLLGFVTAFLGTTAALGATRVLLEKRSLALAAFWILPLGFATLAYSSAMSGGLALATFSSFG